MDAAGYVSQWLGSLSAARWVLDNLPPFLYAAAAVRVVTLLFVPRRGL